MEAMQRSLSSFTRRSWSVTAPLRHDARRAFGAHTVHEPTNLAIRLAEPFSRSARFESAVDDGLNDLEPVQLAHCHGDCPVLVHVCLPMLDTLSYRAEKQTFQLC
jgi:hypothetical protein